MIVDLNEAHYDLFHASSSAPFDLQHLLCEASAVLCAAPRLHEIAHALTFVDLEFRERFHCV